MNRTLLVSVHGVVSALVVASLCALAVFGGQPIGRAPQGSRDYLLWSGWIALLAFAAAYAYVLRKYAHRLGYSPEFRLQVTRTKMELAEERLTSIRERIAQRSLTERSEILGAARKALRETGCQKVLSVRVEPAGAGLALISTRTQPIGRAARWMHSHIYYGLGAGILTFVHGGGRFETPMGIALNGLTLIVVVTGLLGLYFWMFGPTWLSKEERDLSIEEAFVLDRHYARRLEAAVEPLRAVDAAAVGALIAARSPADPDPDLLARLAAALGEPDGVREAQDLLVLAGQRRRVAAELSRLKRVKLAMNAWRTVHVPASIALLAVISAHVLSVWIY